MQAKRKPDLFRKACTKKKQTKKCLPFKREAGVFALNSPGICHFSFINQRPRAYLCVIEVCAGVFVLIKAKKSTMIHAQKKSSLLLGHMIAGAAACAAVLAALLCASAALLCRIDIPLEMTVPLGTGALCLSVLAGSAVTSLLHGKNGMLCGLLFAGIAVLAVGVFSAAQGQPAFSTFTAIKAGSILLCGGGGGYTGILWRESHKK